MNYEALPLWRSTTAPLAKYFVFGFPTCAFFIFEHTPWKFALSKKLFIIVTSGKRHLLSLWRSNNIFKNPQQKAFNTLLNYSLCFGHTENTNLSLLPDYVWYVCDVAGRSLYSLRPPNDFQTEPQHGLEVLNVQFWLAIH